jgi:hypothetical protein
MYLMLIDSYKVLNLYINVTEWDNPSLGVNIAKLSPGACDVKVVY